MRTSVKALSIGALAVTSLFVAPAAFAADATVDVAGGSISSSVTNSDLTGAATSDKATKSAGSYNVSVTDLRGTGLGWSVSQTVTDFALVGDNTVTIPGVNLTVTSMGAVTAAEGSADLATTVVPRGTGNVGAVANAAAGGGEGSYTIPVNVSLDVPAFTKAGTYRAVLSTTTAPAVD